MLKYILFPKIGWFVLHVITIIALFVLGFSINFGV